MNEMNEMGASGAAQTPAATTQTPAATTQTPAATTPAPTDVPSASASEAPAPTEAEVAHLLEIVYRHPRHRELYYKALAFCEGERTVDEAEDFIEEQPEYAGALQTSTVLVNVLIEQGGLAYREYDAEGAPITDERAATLKDEGATDDDLFDMVARRTVRTTPAGCAVVSLLEPKQRIASYVASVPERTRVYKKLLVFCETPRTLDEIKSLLEGDSALEPSERTAWQKLHASYFIDRMDEAGGLAWQGGWVTTEAGRAFLASDDDR